MAAVAMAWNWTSSRTRSARRWRHSAAWTGDSRSAAGGRRHRGRRLRPPSHRNARHLAGARLCGYRRIHVLFQPHRYTRTLHLMDEFARASTRPTASSSWISTPLRRSPSRGLRPKRWWNVSVSAAIARVTTPAQSTAAWRRFWARGGRRPGSHPGSRQRMASRRSNSGAVARGAGD